jgi:anti-sigma-K factor RskA
VADNLEPLQPAKVYELWLIPANGQDPIPAGTFHPDQRGSASVILPPLPKGVEAQAFGVTVEDEGGSLKPTLPIILAGT